MGNIISEKRDMKLANAPGRMLTDVVTMGVGHRC
jgi:hypothetical protein